MTKTAKKSLKNRNRNCLASRKGSGFWLGIANRLIVLLIISAGCGFLVCVNDIAVKGFVLSDLNTEINNLKKQNEELQIKALKLQSMSYVEERALEKKMVKIDTIEYIVPTGEDVAKK